MVVAFKKPTQKQQQPPSCIEAEESVLGGLMVDQEAWARVINILEPHHFYVKAHGFIFEKAREFWQKTGYSDIFSLKTYLECEEYAPEFSQTGGMDKLMLLVDRTVSTVNIDRHAELIVKKWLQRQIIETANDLVAMASSNELNLGSTSEILETVEKRIHELTQSKYRGDLTQDEETRMTDKIVQEIREIENNCVDLVVKEYKMIRLSQRLKMSRKTLEQLYCKFLLSNENDRIYEADDFQGKFGHESKEWFLHGLLPKGVVLMLHALGGEGKTKLSYDFVNSILTGTPWGQFPVTASTRRCLLVQTDETRGDLIRNLEGRGIERHSSLFIKSRWTTEHMASLRKDIIDHKIEVVVIDSLTTVSKGSIVSENETEYAKPILQLKDLAQELGVTILLIHHSNGQGKSRGTKAIHNSVSQVLSLSKPSEGSDVTCPYRLLVIEKSRFRRPAKYKLEYKVNEEDHTWSWEVLGEDSKEPDPIAPVKEQVVEFLSKNRNTPLTNKDISSELGVPYNTIRKTTFQLSTDGIIQREKQDSTKNTWSFFLAWEGEPQETIVNDPIDETFCVEYIGKDPIVKESAKNATELRFIGFDHEDGLAIIKITKPNWIQTQKVGINDIREVQPCLDT